MIRSVRVLVAVSVLGLAFVSTAPRVQAETEVIATIDVGDRPLVPAVNPFTNRIYVPTSEGTVWVIDGDRNRILAAIAVGSRPENIAINPTTNRVYVGHADLSQMSVIDGNTHTVIATPTTDPWPFVAVNPVTDKIIAGSLYGFRVADVNPKTHAVAFRPFGTSPRKPAINIANNRIYVSVFWAGYVRILDGSTMATVGIVDTASGTSAPAVNPFTDMVYAPQYHCPGSLAVIDGQAGALVTTVEVNDHPCPGVGRVAVSPLANRIYAVNLRSQDLAIIDGETNTVVGNIPVGYTDPKVNALDDRVYLPSVNGAELLVIDGQTASVLERVDTGCEVTSAAVNPLTDKVYVPCFYDNKVLVLQHSCGRLADVAPAADLTGRILDLVIDLSGHDHSLVSDLQAAVQKIGDGNPRGAVKNLMSARERLQAERGLDPAEGENVGTAMILDQIILLMIGHY
jgi:YVTN family beta-propeller protein